MGYLASIKTFGDVAAEDDDAVLSYFLKTDAVDEIESGKKFLVIGRKGSGKTALATYFSEPNKDFTTTAPSLRDYPWALHEKRKNLGASEIESYVSAWRYLIAVKANASILQQKGMSSMTDSQLRARNFLEENYGGISPNLGDILKPQKINVKSITIGPKIFGNGLGEIFLENENGGFSPEIDQLADILIENASTMATQVGTKKVFIHFDELDQGLAELNDSRRLMITGLILAIRSIRNRPANGSKVYPVAYLRTDIWDKLKFSDKNKISQSSSTFLEWTAESLLEMVNERIRAKIGNGHSWPNIEDDALMRGSQTKWGHIIARTFLRPRDVIQFLNFALKTAIRTRPEANIFENNDIQAAREPYSKYLKQELDDEVGSHWNEWTEALQACSELATITFTREEFYKTYQKKRTNTNGVSADDALEMLYSFSVIGYRRGIGGGGSGWTFQYTDPDAGWDNAASRLKVHLGLKEFAKLREARN